MASDVDIVIGAQDKASAVLNSVASKVGSFSAAFAAAGPVAVAVGAAVAAAAGTFMTLEAAISGVSSSANKIDALTDVARGLGESVGDLQAFEFAMAEAGNLNADQSIDALKKLQRVVGEIATGQNAAGSDVLKKLGLDAATLAESGPIDQFDAISQKLSEIENDSERVAMAQKLFGKAATDLIPAITAQADGLKSSREWAEKVNAAVSDEGAAAVASMNDSVGRLTTGFEGIANTVAIALAPAVDVVAEGVAEWIPYIVSFSETWIPKAVDGMAYLADGVVDVAKALGLLDANTETFAKGIADARQKADREAAEQRERLAASNAIGPQAEDDTAAKHVEDTIAALERRFAVAQMSEDFVRAEEELAAARNDQEREAIRLIQEQIAHQEEMNALADEKEKQEKEHQKQAERISELADKELQNLEKQRIELSRGKEAAHAYALEMQGLDKATSQKIAADQAAIDLQKAQVVDKSQGFSAAQGRLLQFGRGGDPRLTLLQQIATAVNSIKNSTQTTAQNTSKPTPLPLTGRNYYPVAVVP